MTKAVGEQSWVTADLLNPRLHLAELTYRKYIPRE